jgi:hypothetical protein
MSRLGRRGKNVTGYVCRLCLPAREIKVVVGTAHVGEFRFRHVLLTWAIRRDWLPDTKRMRINRQEGVGKGEDAATNTIKSERARGETRGGRLNGHDRGGHGCGLWLHVTSYCIHIIIEPSISSPSLSVYPSVPFQPLQSSRNYPPSKQVHPQIKISVSQTVALSEKHLSLAIE